MKKSFNFARKAISLDEYESLSNGLLGSVYLMMRKYEKAIESGKRAVELDPNGANIHAFFGFTLSYTEHLDDAIAHYKQAIRLNPFPPSWYYFNLGRCYREKGQYEDALSEFKKALQRSPNSYHCHVGLASVYALLDRQEEAEATAKKLMEINPKFSVARASKTWPYKNPADRKILVDALLKAGLPE
jgi:tetratricopeptide (TPR) repeat protein